MINHRTAQLDRITAWTRGVTLHDIYTPEIVARKIIEEWTLTCCDLTVCNFAGCVNSILVQTLTN